MKNKNELSNIYANRVLFTESKKNCKSGSCGKVGELEGAKKTRPVQGATEKVKKSLKKPEVKKQFSEVKGKPSKMKESQVPNAFNKIFQSVLNEEFEASPETEHEFDETEMDSELDNEFGDNSFEDNGDVESDESDENGDVTSQLQDLAAKLQEIIDNLLTSEDSEEETEIEEEPIADVEEEGDVETEEENPYEESLDLKGKLTELSNKLGDLLVKKSNKVVKGTLGKAKKGKAIEGKIPEQSGKTKAFNPSVKHLQNPKGSNVVSNIKKGDNYIK